MAISMLKIRRPLGRLIFNMGIAIPGKTVFLIETAPRPCFLSDRICLVYGRRMNRKETISFLHLRNSISFGRGCPSTSHNMFSLWRNNFKTVYFDNYNPRFNEVERRVYWYHLVRLSVCGQNRVHSVSSTILIGSISYLHILSSNFRRCVACNACFKIQKFEILANFLNLYI